MRRLGASSNIAAMSQRNLTMLLDQLRGMADEVEWLEFKEAKTTYDLEKLGQYFSALSNEANLCGRSEAWMVLGVHDKTRDPATGLRVIVGSLFRQGGTSLNELKKLIADHTPYRATYREIHELTVNGKRVLMLEIPPAPAGVPMTWKGHLYGREGSSLGSLSLAELDRIRSQNNDWSAEVVTCASLADLDDNAIQVARANFKVKHQALAHEVDGWSDEVFLNKAKVARAGAITRTAILLLGKPESAHFLSPIDPRITWLLKNLDGSDRDYHHFGPPFLTATSQLAQRIRNTPYKFMRDTTLFPDQVLQYDTWILRELLHNCVAHQDYSLNGRITVVERDDSLTFSNLGTFIPGSVENVIAADAPPDRYRNRFLVAAMVSLNMIDTVGSGIPKAFNIQRRRGFPLPDYDLSEGQRVQVTLLGKVLDENYTRALLAKTDLSLTDVIVLDKVQKHAKISEAEFKSLKERHLVEGRRPNIYVAASVAAATDRKADYVLTAGFDDAYYKDLVVKMLRDFGQARPKEIHQMLLGKLPNALSASQKTNKIRNLVQELAREGIVHNVGKHGPGAIWALKA